MKQKKRDTDTREDGNAIFKGNKFCETRKQESFRRQRVKKDSRQLYGPLACCCVNNYMQKYSDEFWDGELWIFFRKDHRFLLGGNRGGFAWILWSISVMNCLDFYDVHFFFDSTICRFAELSSVKLLLHLLRLPFSLFSFVILDHIS